MRGSGDRANVPIKQADCALFHCGKNNLSHNRLQSDSTRCNSLIILIKMPPRCKPQHCHSRLLLWHFYDNVRIPLVLACLLCAGHAGLKALTLWVLQFRGLFCLVV